MILQALHQLYDRFAQDETYEIAPPGFSPQKVSFKIVLREDGSLFAIEDARTVNSKGKKVPLLTEVPAHEKRTSGVKAQFLCDKREYTLGLSAKGVRHDCFEAFKRKHLESERSIDTESFSTVCRFLENWDPEKANGYNIPDDVFESFGVFQIVGEREPTHRNEKTKKWWIEQTQNTSEEAYTAQCLVSGNTGEISRIHPDIKGFKSSVALVGIQENTSYESYGRSKTENCPISKDVAFKYATALNALTAGPQKSKHSLAIADTKAVFWTEKPTILEDCLSAIFENGSNVSNDIQDQNQLNRIDRVLQAVRDGSKFQEIEESIQTNFYLLGLEQPNPGRFSIRFFHRSTVGDLLQKLHDHQNCLRIVREFEEGKGKRKPDPEFPAIWQLLLQTARVSDEIPPLLGGALTRSIVEGTPYPEGLFAAVIRRIRAERKINYLKAAILKAILIRNYDIPMSTTLDKDHPSKGYHLGRLFAVFEQSQRQAHEFKLERTIRETFYSAASANPLSVFSRLHRLHMHHLRKLSGGSQKYFEDWIGEIEQKFTSTPKSPATYPATLNLKEQGLFSIGYYHQMHAMKHKEYN
jgi:CRISPR-associated protein Csd1